LGVKYICVSPDSVIENNLITIKEKKKKNKKKRKTKYAMNK